MDVVAGLLLLPLLVVYGQDGGPVTIGPDRIQEFHACVGTTAYIPWPLNIISRSGHKSTIITLTFQRRHSEKMMVIATYNGHKHLQTEKQFRGRLSVSDEHSGIFLKKVKFDDSGTYVAKARTSSGLTWTRSTNLTVHVRPIVVGGKLNITQSEMYTSSNQRRHCVKLICGTLEYAGYPPAKFIWTTSSKTLASKTATDESKGSVQICSPFLDDVMCSIAGFSSVCTYDHVEKLHIDLPGPPTNSSYVRQATATRDLVLMIVMPILAVAIPLIILGIWVLSHLLKSYPQYREQRHYEKRHRGGHRRDNDEDNNPDNDCMSTAFVHDLSFHPSTSREPQVDLDIEDNVTDEQTHNNDVQGEEETGHTEEENEKGEEDHHEGDNHNNNENVGIECEEEEEEDEDEDDDEEEDSSEDEHKANEEQPLMEDSINPVV